jgi:hypothetical protein
VTIGGVVATLFVGFGVLFAAEGLHILVRGWSMSGYLRTGRRAPLQRLVGVAALVLALGLVLFPWGAPGEPRLTRVVALGLSVVANGIILVAGVLRRRATGTTATV